MVFGFGEGKIDIRLEKQAFLPGEKITGKVVLTVNKPRQARQFRIVFKCLETQTAFTNGRQSQRTIEIYSVPLVLEGEKEYSGTKEYGFEFVVPGSMGQTQNEMAQAFGGILQAASMLAGMRARREWLLDASLDSPGIDINKKIRLGINL